MDVGESDKINLGNPLAESFSSDSWMLSQGDKWRGLPSLQAQIYFLSIHNSRIYEKHKLYHKLKFLFINVPHIFDTDYSNK
jgi:hypothetical protein